MFTRFCIHQNPMRQIQAALVALALIGIAAPVPALAQPGGHSRARIKNPSPGAVRLAKQVMELTGVRARLAPVVPGVIERVKDHYLQTDFAWSKDLDAVAANMEKQYAPKTDQLVNASARIYASYFTEPELKQILAFYRSPVGRKLIEDNPQVVSQTSSMANQWAQGFVQQVIAEMRAQMKKRGHDL